MHVAPLPPERLVYLDWLRVGAFALLILYHVGMFYVTWDWHVKSDHAGHAIEPLMLLTNPWRLTLLFLISGAATRFMADKCTGSTLAGRRSWRLFVPLLFGMAVVVPPQSYFEVVEKIGYQGSYLLFWGRYLGADHGFCQQGDCLILPTWNHLWFVAYLLVYTLIVAALLPLLRGPLARLGAWLGSRSAWILLLAPILYLAAARIWLLPHFEVTHDLVNDWYNHAVSFAAFLFGYLIAKDEKAAAGFIQLRWVALGLFLAAYALMMPYFWAYRAEDAAPPEALRTAMRLVFAIDQWCAIVAALGFGARHLNRDSALLRTLTLAVFPFYIVHQTIIVAAGHWLKSLQLPVAAEASMLIGLTVLGCWLSWEVVRRISWLRPLFGLGPQREAPQPLDPARAAL